MGIFRKTPRAVPMETKGLADPTASLWELFGVMPTASGVTVTGQQALAFPAVSAAIRLISEAAASLTLCVKQIGPDGVATDVAGHPALPLLTRRANDWTSGYEFIRDLVIDALSDDTGGLAFVNRVGGKPMEIIRYRSGLIAVNYDSVTGEPSYTRNATPVSAGDVIHLRAPFGRSPLSLAMEAIATGILLSNHASRLFNNGARPSGALKFPKGMGEASVKTARAAWVATHEGGDNSGKTAILFDGAEFQPITFNSTDAQFIENRKFQILEVARAFRVPPSMLFDLDRATWGNTEQMAAEFLIYCLEPWLKCLEGALTRALIGDDDSRVIRFERDDMTRADLTTRATAISALRAAEVISVDEGRSWVGLGPVPGGDRRDNPHINTTPAAAAPGGDKEGLTNGPE